MQSEGFALDNVSRVLNNGREVVILDGVTASFPGGVVTALVGPSGAGKSSLLRLLNRLDEPSAGTILWRGKQLAAYPVRELRRQVGMLFQTPVLFPGTVKENLLYGPKAGHLSELPDPAELLERVGLEKDFLQRAVDGLSGGQAQRVALARALANRPAALLLDEPTSALDHDARDEIEALIRELQQEEALTVVWITHDVAQARRVAGMLAVMREGRLLAGGPADQMLNETVDPWVRTFLHDPGHPHAGCCRPAHDEMP